jgi:hypothetical protein
MDIVIRDFWTKHPQRGYSMYPTKGRMMTRIMVKLEGDKIARRVYDTCTGKAKKGSKMEYNFAPVILIKDEPVMLTPEQAAQIGYDFRTCRSHKGE